jgi:trehalose 6-phosphate synthase
VLSEFTGAADEMGSAFLVNPHDIEGMKTAILHATRVTSRESRHRMRSLRNRVRNYDVNAWKGKLRSRQYSAQLRATNGGR